MCGEVVVALLSVESVHPDLRKLVLSENSAYWCTHVSHSGLVSFRDAYGGLYLWKGSAICGLGSDNQRRLAWLYSTCACATYEEPSQWLLKAHENENESFILLIWWSLHNVTKKIPSEMEVAPRYNSWHCWHYWHCWHCLTLFDTVDMTDVKDYFHMDCPRVCPRVCSNSYAGVS